ncbi:MAG: chromosomal replication initiator protein DnaA [Bacteroidales bacterium]|nr:chromosomal replication initiator protein DnaA [Bacteroidales bacterium]
MSEQKHINVWEDSLLIIKDIISPQSFRTWFEPIRAINLEGSTLTLEVPSEFFREYLEEHYLDLLSKTLRRVIGVNARLIYKVKIINNSAITYPSSFAKEVKNPSIPMSPGQVSNLAGLDPYTIPGLKRLDIDPNLSLNYSFENFIEGNCNKLGRSAGIEIAKKPGNNAFNPLFLYGGSGLGKTHLAQAIGLEIKNRYPDKIVLYVTANVFMTQYVDAVTVKNKLTDFLHFYQSIDVLIIDDVHEFAEKHSTQNAFFQVFNHLHQLGKQLILTSDRPPVDLQGLDQRLLSRFKWGLTTELLPPDYHTKIAILKAKSFREGISLPDDVINYIASKVVSNIRELEGTLISLIANATLTKRKITLSLAQELIDKIVSTPKNDISVSKIKKTVCDYFGITPEILLSNTRKREIVQARQIAMYLSRNLTNTSLDSIGSQIGGKNHATVLYACNTVCDLMDTDRTFRQYITDIERELRTNIQ